jgi:hypothetical protein
MLQWCNCGLWWNKNDVALSDASIGCSLTLAVSDASPLGSKARSPLMGGGAQMVGACTNRPALNERARRREGAGTACLQGRLHEEEGTRSTRRKRGAVHRGGSGSGRKLWPGK